VWKEKIAIFAFKQSEKKKAVDKKDSQ